MGSSWWGGGPKSLDIHLTHLTPKDGAYDPEDFEFFCDGCSYTIEKNEVRYECRSCPDEYCLCGECYDEEGSQHLHDLEPNRGPFHITLIKTEDGDAPEASMDVS